MITQRGFNSEEDMKMSIKLLSILGLMLVLMSSISVADHGGLHYPGLDRFDRTPSTGLAYSYPFTLPSVVTSTSSPADDFAITNVKVSGVVASTSRAVFVERGTRVPVEVFVTCTDDIAYDTRVRVYIGGYEYGNVEETSEIFEVEPGVDYPAKVLYLNVPEDLEASDDYTLNVEVYDDDNSVRKTYTLRVQE